jgi:hypothetical protein
MHAELRAARCAAQCRIEQIGRIVCFTQKTYLIAADRLLHIKTAHPKSKKLSAIFVRTFL